MRTEDETPSSRLNSSDFVIPSEARDLQFAATCSALPFGSAQVGMTISASYCSCSYALNFGIQRGTDVR